MEHERSIDSIRVDYPAPAHVPKDRVVDLSFALGHIANNHLDPYEPADWLNKLDVPRLLYHQPAPEITPVNTFRGSGSWIVTHYEDINRVYSDNDLFSNRGTAEFQKIIGETFPSIPLAIDPPDHAKYRMFLLPRFAPSSLNRMEQQIRSLVNEMIDEFAGNGEVDIAWDFARVFPVRVFMNLMGFPPQMFEQFLTWEWDILHSNSRDKMVGSLREVLRYLRDFMAEKELYPDDHLVSYIVHGTIDNRPLSEDEKTGMVWFLWLGGLDTVASTITQMFRRMALQPDIQAQLRGHPDLIASAVEEFLRTQPILNSGRTAKKDFEWHGVTVREGDPVLCLNSAGNFDPAQFPDPRTFDPSRKGNRHMTFVAGVHLCLGGPLARRELRILLDEWFKRIPDFKVKEGADTTVFPHLRSIRHLPLIWDASLT